ncbi:MAG: hypothetical protein KAY37_15710 [Phycisphaerae bacterium]|nr:hypothetical protein [Phycisphaerae bacterium]
MMTATESVPVSSVWLRRLRFLLATAIVWAGLHYLLSGYILPRGVDRPMVLVGSHLGPLAGLLGVVLLWIGAAAATLMIGSRDRRYPLMALGLALALWSYEGGMKGGTIDAWLTLQHETPGPPTSGPYWLLLGDYVYLLLAIGGAYAISALLTAGGTANATLGQKLGFHASARERGEGTTALLITTAVAGVGMFILTGSATGATWRGQVYFAVALGFIAGTYLARRITKVRDPLWYWPAPLLLGVIGLLIAAINPALRLPDAYRQLDSIPAWGLARALPVEMVGVGLLAALWMLGAPATHDRQDEEP